MATPFLMRIRHSSVQFLEEVVASWPDDRFDADLAQEVEDAIRACRGWPDEFEALCDSLWRRLAAHKIDNIQQTGAEVLELVDRALRVLEQVSHKAEDFEQHGATVRGVRHLAGVIEKIRQFRRYFQEDGWPWWNEKIRAEAEAEIARGEYQTVEEILRELQGKNP